MLFRSLPEGEVGEICIRSASSFLAYWDNPEATAKALDADRWYRTGDYGVIRDGFLSLAGRRQDHELAESVRDPRLAPEIAGRRRQQDRQARAVEPHAGRTVETGVGRPRWIRCVIVEAPGRLIQGAPIDRRQPGARRRMDVARPVGGAHGARLARRPTPGRGSHVRAGRVVGAERFERSTS